MLLGNGVKIGGDPKKRLRKRVLENKGWEDVGGEENRGYPYLSICKYSNPFYYE